MRSVPLAAILLSCLGCAGPTPAWRVQMASEVRRVTISGEPEQQIAYIDRAGPPEAPTLVFLHGLGQSKACWRHVAPDFEGRFRVLLVDLLGAGDSTTPAKSYAPADQASAVDELLRAASVTKPVLIGFSYGGAVALRLARARFGSHDSPPIGLFLIGPAALDFPPPPRFSWLREPLVRCMLIWLGSPTDIAQTLLRGSFHRDERIAPELVEEYASAHSTAEARAATAAMAIGLFDELNALRDRETEFGAIDCPVWLIRGDHDSVVPADVPLRLSLALPRAAMYEVVDCGHSPAEERPAQTIHLLSKFLTALAGDPPARTDR